jgi:3-phosphoshikimate 1-carboxyvinyltransferase
MTNRALILAALTPGRSTIRQPLHSRDTDLMVAALRALGVSVDATEGTVWQVDGGTLTSSDASIDVGNAGTVLRFVPALATLAQASVSFDGDEAVRRRPVRPLLDALRSLGAQIDDGGRGAAPFVVHGAGQLPGGAVGVDASSSSQLVSALLLAAPAFEQGVEVTHVGERDVPNAPHIAMTVHMLRDRGADATGDAPRWTVRPGPLRPVDRLIEPDLSSAAPFLAAAVVTGGEVRIPDWPTDSTQPGALLPELLAQFGATSAIDGDSLVLRGPGAGALRGADLDLRDGGELTPVLAAVAALAASPSRLTGIDYLRGHETDRLAALAKELSALGAEVREIADGLEITPKALHGGVFSTYDDHRLAMAGAVLGLVVPGVEIENIATTAKTLPGFDVMWSAMASGDAAYQPGTAS